MHNYFWMMLHLLTVLGLFSSLSAETPVKKAKNTLVITCATGALGGETARLLAPDYNLILTGRNSSKLQQLQDELKSLYSGQYDTHILDYLDSASIISFKKKIDALNTPISGILLMTPRPQFAKDLLMQSEPEWLLLFQTTFTGPIEVLKSTMPHLSKNGKIIIIGGTTSVQLSPEYGPASVIRRMWTSYSKALSHQLGPKGITVNVLSPGVVLTNFHQERITKKAKEIGCSYEEQLTKDTANIPLRRHAKPLEIAQTIRFFFSPESDFITGTNLIMDGGATLTY